MTNPNFNYPFDVEQMLEDLPRELDRLVLQTLGSHIGRDRAVSRRDLVTRLRGAMLNLGMPASRLDRNLRLSINRLRKGGYPIASTGGRSGGYFLAGSQAELDEYLKIEVHSRAMDLLEQERAMREGGSRIWPQQAPLF